MSVRQKGNHVELNFKTNGGPEIWQAQIKQLQEIHGDLSTIQDRYNQSITSREATKQKGDNFLQGMNDLSEYTSNLLEQIQGGSTNER